uniref:Major facilitator superfamily (MFS) profile domain-containing protein n=1 Tax=Chlamydomonas euryale TaxID=1486919 RepID=A0A7R9YSH1_9CHLO
MAFGYHLGVVNGPLEAIAMDLGIGGDAALSGVVVSSTLAGAAAGSLSGGSVSDSLGRRKGLLLACAPMLLGPLLSAYSGSFSTMVVGRFMTGIAIGLSSALVPTYISEIAPTAIRGALGTLNQLMICVGILTALGVNVVLPAESWRTMFLIGAVPAAALALGMLACPESPRWLQSKGMKDEADKAATQLWGSAAGSEMSSGSSGGSGGPAAEVSVGELFGQKSFKIGILLFAFQQLAGINALVFFSTSVFRTAGVTSDTLASLAVGATNVLGTVIAASIIEKAGRTSLLSLSYLGQGLSMFAMALGFTLPVLQPYSAPIAVGGTLLYVLSFALGAGPVTGLLIPELNPATTRGRAVAAAFVSHWACNVIVGQTFMIGVQAYGLPAVYAFFGAVAMGAVLYVKTQVPETRGKSFEQIQKELA